MFCTLMNNHQRFTNYFKMYLLFPFKNRKKKESDFYHKMTKQGHMIHHMIHRCGKI